MHLWTIIIKHTLQNNKTARLTASVIEHNLNMVCPAQASVSVTVLKWLPKLSVTFVISFDSE